ncbi:hypothetical protein MAPG_09191 [Magnaporthiopsis poae ATCC 64411]|uniref:Uncharacterized protein n=1 Tax=Magnaporthiopsis poae (strain ATCC 64411 / 73-15) TaxID=644358 RepID=A0A0C4E9B2_MAGP6|nr:hypothetical protein MAPG_09191 [Magnaporthiopsis poae ATCC 64411]
MLPALLACLCLHSLVDLPIYFRRPLLTGATPSNGAGTNSGSTGGRYWFGEVYRGGPTTPANYERVTDPAFGITDSQMYTVKA